MKDKIKAWITSDETGTYIWKEKPIFDKEINGYMPSKISCGIFKVDNSKHLYKEPTEVYISIIPKKFSRPKRANTIKNTFLAKNILE